MISVIIPVYNRDYCLARCLESVLHQTFTDWECILIDDGSTDNTLSVCRHYVETDARFHVYSQPNSGVSAARNLGIEHAEGDYIAFIDSDDWVEANYLQLLYESGGKSMMPLCGAVVHEIDGASYEYVVQNVLYLMEDNITDLLIEHLYSGLLSGPVCKLFDRNIIETHHIRFSADLSWGEDLIFNYAYFQYIDKIKGVPFSLYHIIKLKESLSENMKNELFLTDVNNKLWNSISCFLQKKRICNPDLDAHMDWYYAVLFFQQIVSVIYVHGRLSCKERYKRMKHLVLHTDRTRFRGKKFPITGFRILAVYFKASFLFFLIYEIKYIILSLRKK